MHQVYRAYLDERDEVGMDKEDAKADVSDIVKTRAKGGLPA